MYGCMYSRHVWAAGGWKVSSSVEEHTTSESAKPTDSMPSTRYVNGETLEDLIQAVSSLRPAIYR
jgi:hypothetical protein